jgi:hypothetical protein
MGHVAIFAFRCLGRGRPMGDARRRLRVGFATMFRGRFSTSGCAREKRDGRGSRERCVFDGGGSVVRGLRGRLACTTAAEIELLRNRVYTARGSVTAWNASWRVCDARSFGRSVVTRRNADEWSKGKPRSRNGKNQTAFQSHVCLFRAQKRSYMTAKTGRARCECGVLQLAGLLDSFLRATGFK